MKKLIAIAAIGLTISGTAALLVNTKSANAGYMDDYFRDGMTIKLVTPKGFNVNLPYPTNGGMINTFEPDNTDDWKFVVIRSSADGFKLKRVGTNHLITTKDFPARNLTLLEAWQDVGGEDKFQTWVATPTRPGYFAICLKAQRDQCMNVPNSTNRTRLTTYKFDANDQDQMFSAVVLSSSTGNINLPFKSGQPWYVCQGYNGTVSHQGYYAFDLTVAEDFGSNNACYAADNNVNKSAGREVLAPTAGTVRYISGLKDFVCLEIDSRRSLLIGHIDRKVSDGQPVSPDTVLGTVSQANIKENGGYAHIHIEARQSPRCARGTSAPFTAANGFQFNGIGDLPGPVTNTYWKKELRRP